MLGLHLIYISISVFHLSLLCCVTDSEWTPHGMAVRNTCTIDSQYIAVIYYTIVHTAQKLQWWNFTQIYTHERHTIPHPYGRTMVCLSWVIRWKMTVIYRERTLLYPPHNEVVGGVYWFHSVRPSVRLSVRPSVRPACRVRSVSSTVMDGFFSY